MSSAHANIPTTIPLLQGPTQHFHVLYWNYATYLTVNEEPQSNNPPIITHDLKSKPGTDTCSFHNSKIPKGGITSAMTWQFPPPTRNCDFQKPWLGGLFLPRASEGSQEMQVAYPAP